MDWVDALLVIARVAAGCWLLAFVPRLVRPRSDGDVGSVLDGVSVVIPAHDEAASLPSLLRTLPTSVEVIVVDDHSCDGTAVVAALGGARVIESAPLPAGWTGKAWACEQGAAAASGRTLIFVDADVRFADGGLEAVVARRAAEGGLASVQPRHDPVRPVEHLAAIFNIVAFAGTDAASPLGRARGARGAFGPVLATSRDDYESIGGHESVRGSVVDDMALAARYRSRPLPVTVLAGGDSVSIRMYPGGLAQMVEGFTKNLTAGVRGIRLVTSMLVLAWMTLLIQAAVSPVRAVVAADLGALAASVGLYAVVATQVWWMYRRLGRFSSWVAVTFPVSVVLFLVVFARSVVATTRGGVSWRGRRVPTR